RTRLAHAPDRRLPPDLPPEHQALHPPHLAAPPLPRPRLAAQLSRTELARAGRRELRRTVRARTGLPPPHRRLGRPGAVHGDRALLGLPDRTDSAARPGTRRLE